MSERLYYDDKFFEAIDRNMIMIHLAGEKFGGGYKAEEKQYIEQIQKQLRGSRIISYQFKQNKERCGCCNKLLHRGDLQYFCPNCGSYNTIAQPPFKLQLLKYMERTIVEEILAEASIGAINPTPFLRGLDLIETISTDRRRYFEKIARIRVKNK